MAFAPSFALGATPGTAGGIAWSLEGRWPSVSLGLEGRALTSISTDVPVHTSYIASTVALCLHRPPLFGCGRVEAGSFRFDPDPGIQVEPESTAVVGFAARSGAEWPFTERFAVRGYAEVVGVVTYTKLVETTTHRVLWRMPQASLGFGVGVSAAF